MPPPPPLSNTCCCCFSSLNPPHPPSDTDSPRPHPWGVPPAPGCVVFFFPRRVPPRTHRQNHRVLPAELGDEFVPAASLRVVERPEAAHHPDPALCRVHPHGPLHPDDRKQRRQRPAQSASRRAALSVVMMRVPAPMSQVYKETPSRADLWEMKSNVDLRRAGKRLSGRRPT